MREMLRSGGQCLFRFCASGKHSNAFFFFALYSISTATPISPRIAWLTQKKNRPIRKATGP